MVSGRAIERTGPAADDRYRTFALMFKVLFSVGVLSIPSVFSYVGALPGSLLVIGWGAYNTYAGFLLGAFRLRHSGMHVGKTSLR